MSIGNVKFMKNQPSGSRVVRVFTSIFNVRLWIDWDRSKAYLLYVFFGIKKYFVPQSPSSEESFTEAKNKFELSDEMLIKQQNSLLHLSLLMLGFAFLMLIYTVYQLILGSLFSVIVSVVVMCLALTFAFRYHFWYFQVKERKLGCTLTEWFRRGLMGDKE